VKSKKNIIDDGFNARLVANAIFDGLLEIPVIRKPAEFIIPKRLRPFSYRNQNPDYSDTIMFYEHDLKFRSVLTATDEVFSEIQKYSGVVSPDNSLYYDMPLVLQMTNIYLNRQIGHYLQNKGLYVIPNVRWGDERSYLRIIPDQLPFAFLGLEKNSIYSIGTYGCCKTKEEKHHLREGLRSFIKEMNPQIILVYGPMAPSVFDEFKSDNITFVHYDDWMSLMHKKLKILCIT